MLYCESKKHEETNFTKLREMYTNLPFEEKYKWVIKAVSEANNVVVGLNGSNQDVDINVIAWWCHELPTVRWTIAVKSYILCHCSQCNKTKQTEHISCSQCDIATASSWHHQEHVVILYLNVIILV